MTVYYVSRDNKDSREIVISKVGTKWVYSKDFWHNEKIDKETNNVIFNTKYAPCGTIYSNKEHYEVLQKRKTLWDTFIKAAVKYSRCPPHLTIEDVEQLIKKVKGE